jgi:tetratricopeptide (TPR) repeat protein
MEKGFRQSYIDQMIQAAYAGDPVAQSNLGTLYSYGDGVTKDARLAFRWTQLSAEQGHVDAWYDIGCMYTNGAGVEADDVAAAEWYRKAAEQGHASAQCRLGFIYAEGKGVPKDHAEAKEWFRIASENGHPVAKLHYEAIYANAIPVRKDVFLTSRELARKEEHYQEACQLIRVRRYREALQVLEQLVVETKEGERKIVGSPDLTESVHVGADEKWNLHYGTAVMLWRERKVEQSLREARASALTALERPGPDHVDFAASLNLMGELYFSKGRTDLALALTRRSLVIRFRNVGLWHSEVAESLHNIASYDRAMLIREPRASRLTCNALALRIRVKVFGNGHPAVALSLVWLGRAYMMRYDFKPALKSVRKGISIYEATVGPDHLMTQRAKRALEGILNIEAQFKTIINKSNMPPLSDPS